MLWDNVFYTKSDTEFEFADLIARSFVRCGISDLNVE
jgi:hypothetical protein